MATALFERRGCGSLQAWFVEQFLDSNNPIKSGPSIAKSLCIDQLLCLHICKMKEIFGG